MSEATLARFEVAFKALNGLLAGDPDWIGRWSSASRESPGHRFMIYLFLFSFNNIMNFKACYLKIACYV